MPRNESGAVTIHVAIALIALLSFAAVVVDYGAMWVARRQAQNAADAGALAGAGSMLLEPANTTQAIQAATYFAGQNPVWGQQTAPGDVVVSTPLPWPCPASAGGGNACIRVDVLRGVKDRANNPHTNTMPTYMSAIFGLTSQGVRATAMAQVAAGNAVQCIKPWVVVDRWTDNSGTGTNTSGWDQDDVFNPGVDTYTPTGFSVATDLGMELMLKGEGKEYSSGWSLEVDLNGGNGGNVYRDEIGGCPTWVPTVGQYDPTWACNTPPDTNPPKGCLNVKDGVKAGPTVQGVHDLVALDPSATWNTGTNSVTGGCTTAGTCGTVNPAGVAISPRIVPIALFDPQSYVDSGCSGNNCMAHVVNVMGFFVEGMCDEVYPTTPPSWCGTGSDPSKTVVGRMMVYPGQANSASGSAGPASFLKITRLVQ